MLKTNIDLVICISNISYSHFDSNNTIDSENASFELPTFLTTSDICFNTYTLITNCNKTSYLPFIQQVNYFFFLLGGLFAAIGNRFS